MNIQPFDSDIKERLQAVSIVNDFRYMGCRTRADFIMCVSALDAAFDNAEQKERLVRFWNGRDKTLIPELQNVLVKLKSLKNA